MMFVAPGMASGTCKTARCADGGGCCDGAGSTSKRCRRCPTQKRKRWPTSPTSSTTKWKLTTATRRYVRVKGWRLAERGACPVFGRGVVSFSVLTLCVPRGSISDERGVSVCVCVTQDQKPRVNMVKTVRSYMLKKYTRKREADHNLERFCTSVIKHKVAPAGRFPRKSELRMQRIALPTPTCGSRRSGSCRGSQTPTTGRSDLSAFSSATSRSSSPCALLATSPRHALPLLLSSRLGFALCPLCTLRLLASSALLPVADPLNPADLGTDWVIYRSGPWHTWSIMCLGHDAGSTVQTPGSRDQTPEPIVHSPPQGQVRGSRVQNRGVWCGTSKGFQRALAVLETGRID
eukprot:3617776-Rhodomonas_salina.2